MEPSFFTAIASWATTTSFFLLLNVVIGFIAVSSFLNFNINNRPPPPGHHQEQPQRLVRAPSYFSRVTSFNFRGHSATLETENRQLITPIPSFLSRMMSFNSLHLHTSAESETVPVEQLKTDPPIPSFFSRMTSFKRSVESETISAEEPQCGPSLLRRMASIKLSLHRSTKPEPETAPLEQHVTRSATEPNVRKKKKKKKLPTGNMKKSSSEKEMATFRSGDVDAQADDFINRFKQQLRMQRLESLLRYRSSSG